MSGITTITFNTTQGAGPLTIGSQSYFQSDTLNYTNASSLASLTGFNSYSGATQLTAVLCPSSMVSLESNVFQNCTALTTVTFAASTVNIGTLAFSGCTSLATITIPSGTTSISASAFASTALTSISGSGITSIGISAFLGCTFLATASFNSVVTIGQSAFQNSGLNSFTMPNSLTSIGSSAFFNTKFTSVTIGTNVTTLASAVFQNCPSLSSVDLQGVTVVGSAAFRSCSVLSSVTCPNIVTISSSAFLSTNISSITLPNSLTSIGNGAFVTTALINLIIPNSVTTIGNSAFSGATPFNWVDNSSATLTLGTTVFPTSFNDASKTLYTSSSLNPIYSYVYTNYTSTNIVIGPSCYHEDTYILTDNGYIQIKNIEVGANIKTLNDGYKKVTKTHFQPFRSSNYSFTTKMCKQTLNNEFGEVWMTGGHCTLLDEYPEFMDEYAKTNKDEWMIDGKYIAFVGLNKQFQEMEEKCYYVNHIVLENDDVKRRYAIYANGILSESMSEHYYDSIRNHK